MEIQNNDRIKQMVVRYVKGELSEEEMDELKRWRDERAEHEELFRNVVSREKLERGIRRFVKTSEQQELEWNRILNRTVRKKTALSENVVDALCRFVCLTFVGRRDRVFFMGYYTGNRAGSNFSPNCSRCVHGRVGIAGWNESMVGSRSESGFGRGSEK